MSNLLAYMGCTERKNYLGPCVIYIHLMYICMNILLDFYIYLMKLFYIAAPQTQV